MSYPTRTEGLVDMVSDQSWGWPKGFLLNSYYTKVYGRALLLSLDCSTLPLIHTLYYWVISKEVSSTIFKVFGMMRLGIEPRSLKQLTTTLPTKLMIWNENMNRTFWKNALQEILTVFKNKFMMLRKNKFTSFLY